MNFHFENFDIKTGVIFGGTFPVGKQRGPQFLSCGDPFVRLGSLETQASVFFRSGANARLMWRLVALRSKAASSSQWIWERKWRKFIGLHLKITFLDGVYVLDEFEEKKYKVPGFSGLQSRDIHTKCSKNRAVRRLQGNKECTRGTKVTICGVDNHGSIPGKGMGFLICHHVRIGCVIHLFSYNGRDPNRRDPESFIVNGHLLCPHGGLLYNPATSEEPSSSNRFVVVTEVEWNKLLNFYSVDCDIVVRRDLDTGVLISEPDVCEECVLARLEVEEMELLQYKKAKIFVRKIADTDSNKCQSQDSGRDGGSAVSEYKDDPEYQKRKPAYNEIISTYRKSFAHIRIIVGDPSAIERGFLWVKWGTTGRRDGAVQRVLDSSDAERLCGSPLWLRKSGGSVDLTHLHSSSLGFDAKRPKLATSSCGSATPGDGRVRKSTRHRRMRGEKELYVSSTLKLLDLKVMLLKQEPGLSFSTKNIFVTPYIRCRDT
ncbi:Ubiquitin carboxyl-terminal hydrolase 48 [Zootermopsis nevadensis]|uniref:Ubiquitin carboxyl-terminal hydrolase 48 n=1 Tax=Zootermopsis nevadensis TaxID=136037 RepID=A0A067QS71_ZOONE|nr:Ubiquitin carboxyl-terminal hydrolase 48 [Zootermopsis nevadensis]